MKLPGLSLLATLLLFKLGHYSNSTSCPSRTGNSDAYTLRHNVADTNTWSWLGHQNAQESSFTYNFDRQHKEVRFCFSIPYLQANLDQFLQKYKEHPNLAVHELFVTADNARDFGHDLARALRKYLESSNNQTN